MVTNSDILSYAEASQDLHAVMDKVWDDNAPLVITREGGRHVVVMNKEEYDGWCETEYLASTPANARALNEALEHLHSGKPLVCMRLNAAGEFVRDC